MDQLELALGARVYPFPITRNIRKVQSIALRLNELHGADATRYWHDIVTKTQSDLAALGLSPDEVALQLYELFDSVQEVLAWTAMDRHEGGG